MLHSNFIPLERSGKLWNLGLFYAALHRQTMLHCPVDVIVAQFWLQLMGFLVHQAVVVYVLHILVELIDNWKSIGHLKWFYLLITYALYMLEKRSKSIFVRHDDDPFFIFDFLDDLIFPEWNNSRYGVFHGLDCWESIARNVFVLFILTWMAEVRKVHAWWWTRVAGSPLVEVLLRNGGSWTVFL